MRLPLVRSRTAARFEQALHDGRAVDAQTDELVGLARKLAATATHVPEPDESRGRLALQSLVAAEQAKRPHPGASPPSGRRTGRGTALTLAAVAGAGLLVASAATGGQTFSSVRDVVSGIRPLQLVFPAAPAAREDLPENGISPSPDYFGEGTDAQDSGRVVENPVTTAPIRDNGGGITDAPVRPATSAGGESAQPPRANNSNGVQLSEPPAGPTDVAGSASDLRPTPAAGADPRATPPPTETPASSAVADGREGSHQDPTAAVEPGDHPASPTATTTPVPDHPSVSPTQAVDTTPVTRLGDGTPSPSPSPTSTAPPPPTDVVAGGAETGVATRPPKPTTTPTPTPEPEPSPAPPTTISDSEIPGFDLLPLAGIDKA